MSSSDAFDVRTISVSYFDAPYLLCFAFRNRCKAKVKRCSDDHGHVA
jgi:hypothetical protein